MLDYLLAEIPLLGKARQCHVEIQLSIRFLNSLLEQQALKMYRIELLPWQQNSVASRLVSIPHIKGYARLRFQNSSNLRFQIGRSICGIDEQNSIRLLGRLLYILLNS
ncbi:hypothetical protein D3C77_300620 [compost metagenome]